MATDFPTFAAILRLSTKYDVPNLRDPAAALLTSSFPSSLDLFSITPKAPVFRGIEIAVVNLAREVDLLQVLPSAMYIIAINAADEMFSGGVGLADGSCIRLQPEDERACLLARDIIRRELHNTLCPFIFRPTMHRGCVCYRCDRAQLYLIQSVDAAICERALGPFHGEIEWRKPEHAYCRFEAHEYEFDSSRRILWNKLPSWFGLPTWTELCGTEDPLP